MFADFTGARRSHLGGGDQNVHLAHLQVERPQGVERNIVVTTWEWGDPKKYLHDLIASDRRFPTVNAHGPLYGSPEYATDDLPILDPRTHTVTVFRAPVRDADTPESRSVPILSPTEHGPDPRGVR